MLTAVVLSEARGVVQVQQAVETEATVRLHQAALVEVVAVEVRPQHPTLVTEAQEALELISLEVLQVLAVEEAVVPRIRT